MASAAYRNWVADGRPKRYGRAVQAVALRLRAHGYTVYLDGNQDHLEHEPPEDHTFFSATGWPGKAPYSYCLAMDIMPPKPGQRSLITGQLLPSLQALSAQLYADKQDGVPGAAFVKYMNWEPERNDGGPCYQDSWKPGHARRASSDRGHTHVSSRTDYATSAASDDYDLVARTMGDDDMPLTTDIIELTADTAKEIGRKAGDKMPAATLLQLAVIFAARGDDKAEAARVAGVDNGKAVAGLHSRLSVIEQWFADLSQESGNGDPQKVAEALRAVLGDRAPEVGRILAGS